MSADIVADLSQVRTENLRQSLSRPVFSSSVLVSCALSWNGLSTLVKMAEPFRNHGAVRVERDLYKGHLA